MSKIKWTLFIPSAIIALIVGFYFTGILNMALMRLTVEISSLSLSALFESIATNKNHKILLLCVELFAVSSVAVLFLLSSRENFESDTSAVTKVIKTPVSIGQGQHGTARWLKKEERKKAFSVYELEPLNLLLVRLMAEGEKDREEVHKYGRNSQAESDEEESSEVSSTKTLETPQSSSDGQNSNSDNFEKTDETANKSADNKKQ